MKKITTTTIIVLALIGASIGYWNPAPAYADECVIRNATISPHTENGSGGDDGFYSNATRNNKPVTITVHTLGCEGTTLYTSLSYFTPDGIATGNESALDQKSVVITIGSSGSYQYTLIPGEKKCSAQPVADCRYGIRVGKSLNHYDYSSFGKKNGQFEYECEGLCNDVWTYKSFASIPNPYKNPFIPKAGCSVTEAEISPHTDEGSSDNGYYSDANRKNKTVTITVYTTGCEDEKIYVSLTQFNTFDKPTNGWVSEPDDVEDKLGNTNVAALDHRPFTSSTGAFKITLHPGQEKCAAAPGVADCRYSVRAGPDPVKYQWTTRNDPNGNLDYDCDSTNGLCPDKGKWEYLTFTEIPNKQANIDNKVVVQNNVASDSCTGQDCYQVFSGLADALGSKFNTIKNAESLGELLNALIAFGIGLGGVLAVVMIMYEGFLYMKTDNVSAKSLARSRIVNTVAGFVLLLSIYTILRTINPDLLNLMPRVDSADFLTGGDPDTVDPQTGNQQYSSFKAFAQAHNIPCDGTGGAAQIPAVAQAMVGKITYSMEKRGQTCENDTFCLDCSGFVGAVYSCVGLSSPGYTTGSIFPGGAVSITSKDSTTINGKVLSNGDLLGWIKGSISGPKTEKFGHVIMYIGNGKVIESTGANKKPGKAIQIKNTLDYGVRIKSFKDLP